MIGIILIYFVGKAFYDLAMRHEKNKWAFAILGVASYYLGTFLMGVLIGILIEFQKLGSYNQIPDFGISLMSIPIGVLLCWGLYRFLKYKWERPTEVEEDILDSDLLK